MKHNPPQVVIAPALPKQIEFLQAVGREILYSGAFGAGKSRALCLKAVMRALVPGAREAMCRKHLVTFKATTLRTLLEPEGNLPPVLPRNRYHHHKSDKTIRIKGGGEIVYFGLDEPEKLGSRSFTGVGIDEAIETTEADWTMLRGRVRLQVDGLEPQMYAATNPGPPMHWMARRFGLAMGFKPAPNTVVIRTRSDDNHFLPESYLADINTFVGVAHKRYVLGEWAGSEALVYDNWDRQLFVQKRVMKYWANVVFGVDVGYTNPATCYPVCRDGDGRRHIPEELYERRLKPQEFVDKIVKMAMKWEPSTIFVDPSAPDLIDMLQEEGLPAEPADNDRESGVRCMQGFLTMGGDGLPRCTVDPRCENFIQEVETYENKKDKATGLYLDDPIKRNDHAMDATRYAFKGDPDESLPDWDGGDEIEGAALASTRMDDIMFGRR